MIHLVTLDFPPRAVGGVASWSEDLARALVAAGEAVTVYARRGGDTGGYDRGLPFPVRRLWGRSWVRWQAVWAALGVGGALRPGHRLICAAWPIGEHLVPRARARGVRSAVAFHGSELTRLQGPPRGLRRVLDAADVLLPVSRFLAAELGKFGGVGRVLPMPLSLGSDPAPEGEGLVTVARLTPLKGVDRALRIAAALGWTLDVVGDGPEQAGLERLAAELGVEARFLGRRSRADAVAACRGRAACLLLPRAEPDGRGAEGLGLALLEAMGQGTPAVGCRTGGVPEAVGPGLLLDDPDDAGRSAAQIRAWNDPSRRIEAWRWVRAEHGGARAAAAVLEALA